MAGSARKSVASTSRHAAIYTRISDDKEGTELGVARQLEDSRALANRLGLEVVAEFSDNNVSASTNSTKDRPQYNAMLEGASSGDFAFIVAYSNSRLTRRLRETLDLIELFKTHGVTVKTVASGEFDLSTADGRATAITLATWDQAEAERVGERVKRAADQRVASGRWHGGVPPFGFRKEDKQLHVDPREATLVREAADRVLNLGDTLYGIVQDWNKRGEFTRSGSPWRHSSLRKVLTNQALVVLTRIVVDVGETSVVELELSRFPRVHGGLSCPTLMPG